MWRLIGALLLTGAGSWLGIRAAGELSRRARTLESWAQALALLKGELSFRLPDLPRLLESLSHRAPQPAAGALASVYRALSRLGEESFANIWTRTLTGKSEALTGEDLEPLLRLGAILGRCGWEEQREMVERTEEELSRRAVRLREELSRKGRTYGALGLSLGAFLTILLL